MTLLTSGRATGRRCAVCGSPDGRCFGAHASTEVVALDLPTEGTRMTADVIVDRVINGHKTQVLANSEEAEREGWPIVRNLDGSAYHKKRPAPEAPKPAEPEPAPEPEPAEEVSDGNEDRAAELEAKTKPEVYDIASALEIAGRSSKDKGELIAAILEAEAGAR